MQEIVLKALIRFMSILKMIQNANSVALPLMETVSKVPIKFIGMDTVKISASGVAQPLHQAPV